MTFLYLVLLYLLLVRVAIITAGVVCVVLGYKLFCKGMGNVPGSKGGTDIESAFASARLTVKNAAPGTAFAVFGAIVIVVMLIQSSPSVTWENVSKWRSSGMAAEDDVNANPLKAVQPQPVGEPSQTVPPVSSAKTQRQSPTESASGSAGERATKIVLRGTEQAGISTLTALGIEYERKGDLANAERSYREAVNQMAEPMNDLAWLYYQSGRSRDALGLATLAVQLRPDEPKYQDTLVKVKAAAQK